MVTLQLQRFGGMRVAGVWFGGLRGRAESWGDGPDAGYALTDALVAMLILAMSLGLSLTALGQARDVADVAWEARRAQALMSHLIEAAPHRYATSAGMSDGFAWTVETATTGAERPIEVCRRAVRLEGQRSGRTYGAATQEPCPVEPNA